MELRLFSYEIKYFNMLFMQINSNSTFRHFKHGRKQHIMKVHEILSILHILHALL